MVQRRQRPVMSYQEKLDGTKKVDPASHKSVDVGGADRAKFFCPIINLPPKDWVGVCDTMPKFTIESVESKQTEGNKKHVEGKKIQILE